jgi:PAS domain S-box-containing protein
MSLLFSLKVVMKPLPEKNITLFFGIAIFLLSGIGIVFYWSIQKLQSDQKWVLHTHQVTQTIDNTFDQLRYVEGGRRGYLITQRVEYLEASRRSQQRMEQALTDLEVLTEDNPTQQQLLRQLQPLVNARIANIQQSVQQFQDDPADTEAQVNLTQSGMQIQSQVQAKITAMQAEENRLLNQRIAATNTSMKVTNFFVVLGYCLSFGLLLGVFALLKRQIQARRSAAEAVLARQRDFITLVENSPDIVARLDRNFRHIYINSAIEVVTGMPPQMFVNKTLRELGFPTETVDAMEPVVRRAFETGQEQVDEFTWLTPKGAKQFQARLVPEKLPNGDVQSVLAFAHDITEKQQAAQATLVNILETITDAFVSLDGNWCYTYVNQRAGELFNRRPEDLIGKNIWTEFPEGVGQPFYQMYYQAIATQQALQLEEYYPPWSRWFENRIYPSPEGISIFFQDITPRKQAEIALRESEQKYASLTATVPVGIFRTDVQGNNLYHNDRWCEITGLTLPESMGEGWIKALHPDDQERISTTWHQAIQTNQPFQSEHRLIRPNGDIVWVYAQASAEKNAEGTLIGYVGTLTDISIRKQAEVELQRAKDDLEFRVQERTVELQKVNQILQSSNQELEQFSYIVSHDLQEPLRAIAGYARLMEEDLSDRPDPSLLESLQFITEGATRMRLLIQDLLAYAQTGKTQQNELIDCKEVVQEAIANLQITLTENHATITYDLLPTLQANKKQLVPLFQNLLCNAIKFRREEPPQIHIGVNSAGLFWVKDNGIGIKPEYLTHIFDVFRRLHTRRKYPGTGIGLAICKKTVERYGGSIWAESEYGSGTTIYFTLPLPSPADESSPSAIAPSSSR